MLKPVDDARMFEKMGQTLAETGQYEIHILGFPCFKSHYYPDIHFHHSVAFKRLSLYRLAAPFRILKKTLEINPAMLVITTHELLTVAVIIKMLKATTVIYDVRENFFRNILYLPTFPLLLRPFLASYVRIKEITFSLFVNWFILSEKGYKDEMPFVRKKCTVIENKVKRSSIQEPIKSDREKIELLFSGTLAESTGVFNAISLATQLHRLDSRIRLRIIGYCARGETLSRIRSLIDKDYIQLEGGDTLVPHDEIMEHIARADFGIIAYPPNQSTKNTVPTKLFEYLGSHLPFLLINHQPWVSRCEPYSAAIPFDPDSLDTNHLLERMMNGRFYTQCPGVEIFWEPEGERLADLFGRIGSRQ